MNFKDIYKKPFELDEYNLYVWTKNRVMIFTRVTRNEDLVKRIINKLNDSSEEIFNVSFEDGYICINNEPVLLMRSWGHLTGGLGLDNPKAAKIQDDFCNWVVKKLKE